MSPTVAVVCHDTGAAFALASFAASQAARGLRLVTVCSGPASAVFRAAGIIPDHELDREPSEDDAGDLVQSLSPSALLFGTSFDAWTDRQLCRAARTKGVFTVGLVDWWSNFGRRFSTPGTVDLAFLPDTVAVLDKDAREGCCSDSIPPSILAITGNPYWDRLYDSRQGPAETCRTSVRRQLGISDDTLLGLIISSNLRNLGLHLGYDEADFFRAAHPFPDRTIAGRPISWVVKPHPKESPSELRDLLDAAGIQLRLLEGISAIDAVLAADLVLGMCSSVLLEAAILGRTVVSLQPGVDENKMRYLRIFNRLGIPTIIRSGEARSAVTDLVNGRIAAPDLARLPFPIGQEHAAKGIAKVIRDGISSRSGQQRINSVAKVN